MLTHELYCLSLVDYKFKKNMKIALTAKICVARHLRSWKECLIGSSWQHLLRIFVESVTFVSALMLEAASNSERPVKLYQSTRRCILELSRPHTGCHEKIKSYIK
jgi:hypothetical protein